MPVIDRVPTFALNPGSENSSWDKIPMGVGAAGEVFWDVSKAPSMFICGYAGSGKSVAQKTIIFHTIQHSDKWDFLGIDLKGVELSAFKKYDTVKGVATELEDAVEILRYAKDSLMQRYKQMGKMGVTHFRDLPNPPKALMIMTDEAHELLRGTTDEQSKEPRSLLADIARLGRAAGVHLVLASQRPPGELLLGGLKWDFNARYAVGAMKNITSMLTLESDSATRIPSIPGRAIMSISGNETVLQGYETPLPGR